MHPLWYEIEEDGLFRTNSNGKKIPQFDRPYKLLRLSMAEKLLIQRCASFVPSIHLSNGTFELKGLCVTFPQDITKMCNKLLLRKEAVFCLYATLVTKIPVLSIPNHCMSTNRMYSKLSILKTKDT
jgi:hypothetical protein